MPSVAATSHADRLPVTDGRSAEAQYLRRIRDELRQHVGGSPTIAQRLLIDRVAHTALRLHALDCEPVLTENSEYLNLPRSSTILAKMAIASRSGSFDINFRKDGFPYSQPQVSWDTNNHNGGRSLRHPER
jgi:hypothetical protein